MTRQESPPAPRKSVLRSYGFSLILIGAVLAGSVLGLVLKDKAEVLKPAGDIFLHSLFAMAVPLIFFSIAAAVASMSGAGKLMRIMGWMIVVFVATGVISSSIMVVGVEAFPPALGAERPTLLEKVPETAGAGDLVVKTLTVPDFVDLLSKKNVLPLVLFAILIGLAARGAGEKGRAFTAFLVSASEVFLKAVSYVMYYAPIGMAAYFASLVGVFGPKLLGGYARAMALYYPVCIGYFFVAFTAYAWLGGGRRGIRSFWGNILPPSLTALGTGSSYATIPSNLLAADRVGVPREISELVIPVGATIHMDGSCLSAIVKIAFLYGVFGQDFTGPGTIAAAIGVAILSGTVMSGIPGGGFTGEILIVAMYPQFPAGIAFPIISTIGMLVDPPATLVNAVGDNVASMIVARILGGKRWMERVGARVV
jgi:Na+/H+-dicarboxylate symporter